LGETPEISTCGQHTPLQSNIKWQKSFFAADVSLDLSTVKQQNGDFAVDNDEAPL
jgi:hypothetical protein